MPNFHKNFSKLEELLSELNQLDLAVSEGALTNDMAHLRALIVGEIHKVHSQLPPYLKRRYSTQMPSTMKRIVCVPVTKSTFALHRGVAVKTGWFLTAYYEIFVI